MSDVFVKERMERGEKLGFAIEGIPDAVFPVNFKAYGIPCILTRYLRARVNLKKHSWRTSATLYS